MGSRTDRGAQADATSARRGRPRVVVAGLGDTGVLIATRLARTCDVVGVATRPALVSGQELGARLTDPAAWRASYLVHYRRFRRLDRVRTLHGRIVAADLEARTVRIALADGTETTEAYDLLVIATGASNGFWRHDRVQDLGAVEAEVAASAEPFGAATTVAIVGGGATGVSVADNLARHGRAEVHLFHSGAEPLPGYHPRARRWIVGVLERDGVHRHPDHRAALPPGFRGEHLTHEPIEWASGQPPFRADVVLWAVGGVVPHTAFLPAEVLDDAGFVRVDEHLRVPGHPEVFAVGDCAASDPHRSSARNWGWRIVVANARAVLAGRTSKLRRYEAPEYRWGSVLGLQAEGLTVVQPDGRRFRIPRRLAEPLLFRGFVDRYLYGGLRKHR